jgi:hypothetical protein
MKFNPKKKVGSPASVRGIRGTYLLYMIGYILGGLFGFLIVGSLPVPFLFKGVGMVIIIGFIIYKYLDYMKLSKGDMQMPVKLSCRISLIIKK